MLLALDQATVLGWACGTAGAQPMWGSIRFEGDWPGEVHANFRAWLVRTITDHRPERVCFEKPFIPTPRAPRFAAAGTMIPSAPGIMMNALTLRRLLYMAGCIEEVCASMGVPDCREVSPAEVEKFLLGKRGLKRAQKKAATMSMIRAMGFDVQDDNAGDAVAIWLMMEARFYPALAQKRGVGPLWASAPAKGNADVVSRAGHRSSRI